MVGSGCLPQTQPLRGCHEKIRRSDSSDLLLSDSGHHRQVFSGTGKVQNHISQRRRYLVRQTSTTTNSLGDVIDSDRTAVQQLPSPR